MKNTSSLQDSDRSVPHLLCLGVKIGSLIFLNNLNHSIWPVNCYDSEFTKHVDLYSYYFLPTRYTQYIIIYTANYTHVPNYTALLKRTMLISYI